MKIIGNTVGMGLPKPNLMQTDPTKGDYVKGKEQFLEQASVGSGIIVSDTAPEDASVLWVDTSDNENDEPAGGTVTPEQIASAVEDYMAEHPIEVPDSSQNPTGTKVYVTLADDGTIVIAPDVGDGLTNGVTITASLADDGTIVIGGE